jgi:signal transduction histidine kinase
MAISEARFPRNGIIHKRERPQFVVLTLLLAVPAACLIAIGSYQNRGTFQASWEELLVAAAAFSLLSVLDLQTSGGRTLSPDVPLLLAICLMFQPAVAGVVVFVSSLDKREFAGGLTVTRSLFNRLIGAILALVTSYVAHALPPPDRSAWQLGVSTIVCLLVLTVTNYLLVSIAGRVADGMPFLMTMHDLVLGRPVDFVITWTAWGLMGLLLVAAEQSIGWLAIIAFTGPALIGRQVLARSESALLAEAKAEGKQRAIEELSDHIFEERRDERERIASHLHDEVLQPLFQVSLMCDVVKQDSATGRLLDLDKDVPLLNLTIGAASKNLRGVIGRLRNSPIGVQGLASTLRRLGKDLETQTRIRISQSIEDVHVPDPTLQLTVYQVAKEALTNAVRHSRATQIQVLLSQDVDAIRLSVEDNGVGFDPSSSHQDHFGLLIMRERAEAAGGVLMIDSRFGEGTIVAARFPLGMDSP